MGISGAEDSVPLEHRRLSTFWAEAKYNFGYPEKLIALHWDQLYLGWIPRVMATKSTADYYRELILLCARLTDGHTNVYPPRQPAVARPPLRAALFDERVLIVEAGSPSLETQGACARAWRFWQWMANRCKPMPGGRWLRNQSASPQPSPPFKKPDKPDKSGWQI